MRFSWRVVFAPVLALCALLAMGSADTAVRFNDLGHELICTCGCGQVLLECNHRGCEGLEPETAELHAAIDRGQSDKAILSAFQQEYGPTVLAAPMLTRFNIVAWVVPPALLLLGIAGTLALVRKWRLRAASIPPPSNVTGFSTLRERIRKETEL